MCGIAGVMTPDGESPPRAAVEAMAEAMAHRGPDGRGFHARDNLAMAHRRLSIIDLETGGQPLLAGDAALIANGEIYNHVELRQGMPEVNFATGSDCEPALHLYLRHGTGFTDHLRGMYAVAIHDAARKRLVLARDPFGIKPLYYSETARGLVFASEPSALIRSGLVGAEMLAEKCVEMLQLQFTTGRTTPFKGIQRLLPGETIVAENGRIIARSVRPALPTAGPRPTSAASALDRLDQVLNDTVGMHQRSDVPYGMFLSGGIDSSVLLAMMARLNERPVKAFTAAFPGTAAHDEREQARAVAAAVGADHVEVTFDADDFWRILPRVAAAMDDPAADYAVLPTWKLAETAREHGIKVVLSGEGGDEMFAGYGRYRRALRWRIMGGRPMRSKGIMDGLGLLKDQGKNWHAGLDEAEIAARTSGRSHLQRLQAMDVADWLPNDLLTKLDRCLMAHGVEGRVPFLDPVLADFAFSLPDKLKLKRDMGKWLLRRWLETGLPAARPFDRKLGFTVPVEEWIAERGASLGPLVANQKGIAALCRKEAVISLFAAPGRKQGKAAWTLLFFALWHQHHVMGVPIVEDVGEMLATGIC